MREKSIYIIICLFINVLILKAQDVSVTGNFQDTPLVEVIEALEK